MSNKTNTDMRNLLNDEGLSENDVFHYQDKRKIAPDNIKILIVCYDSLMKFTHFRPTHLILDEFKNITKRFTKINIVRIDDNGTKIPYTNADKELQVNHFFRLFNTAIAVKLYDADCDEYLLDYLKNHTNKKFTVYSLVGYEQYNNNIVIKSHNEAIRMIVSLVNNGKNVSISCGWKSLALKICDVLSASYQLGCGVSIPLTRRQMNICVIHADGAYFSTGGQEQNQSQQKLNMINDTTLWKNFDIVIYTPTITTGISFNDNEFFHTHFAFVGIGADATQQAQMIYRVRKLKSKTIVIVSIEDKIKTLQSNVRGTTSELAIENSYIELNNANVDKNKNLINYVPCENTIVAPLNYDNGFIDGFVASQSGNTSSIRFWSKIDSDIDKSSSIRLLYDVIRSCYLWGSRDITYQFYDTLVREEMECVPQEFDIDLKCQAYADYRNNNFKDALFIDVDYTEEVANDGSQYSKNMWKSKLLISLGYSHNSYNFCKKRTDNYFEINNNDDVNVNNYRKSKQVNLYLEYKSIIYELFNHSIREKGIDYWKMMAKCKSSKAHIIFITKIVALYIAFKVFDIIEIENDEISLILIVGKRDFGRFEFEKDKYFDKIKAFINSNEVQNAFNAICSFGQKFTAKSEYNKIDSILNFAFKHIGMEVKLHREKRNSPEDGKINIISPIDYRLQKSRDYTNELNENEYDDLYYKGDDDIPNNGLLNNPLIPKIRLAGAIEKKTLLEMTKLWVSDKEEAYRINGLIFDIDTAIGSNRHNIVVDDTDTDTDTTVGEIIEIPKNMTFNAGKQSESYNESHNLIHLFSTRFVGSIINTAMRRVAMDCK
jgi:hypothetical protein